MAQGGVSWSDDEDGDVDTDDSTSIPLLPIVAGLLKEGDEHFKARQFNEAAEKYSVALHWPIPTLGDVSFIGEYLFRMRATCYFRLGEYFKAIDDCDRAIEIAAITLNKKVADSVYIKAKAVMCIGDLAAAFPLALWCKILKPKSLRAQSLLSELREGLTKAFNKSEIAVYELLKAVLGFAELMEVNEKTREVALECYTELINLIDFMRLHGVYFRRARCFMNMGRYDEAKKDCEKALWSMPDDIEYFELIHEIMKRQKEKESENIKQKGYHNERQSVREQARPKQEIRGSELETKDKNTREEWILQEKQQNKQENARSSGYFNPVLSSREKFEETTSEEIKRTDEAETSNNISSKKGKRKKKKKRARKSKQTPKEDGAPDPNAKFQQEKAPSDILTDDDESQDTVSVADSESVLDDVDDEAHFIKLEGTCTKSSLNGTEDFMSSRKRCQAPSDWMFHPPEIGIYPEQHDHSEDTGMLIGEASQRYNNAEKKQPPSSMSPSHTKKAKSNQGSFVRAGTETENLSKTRSKTVYISPGDTRIAVQQSFKQSASTTHSGNQPQEPVHRYQNKENEVQSSTMVSPCPWKQSGQRNTKSQEKASRSEDQKVSPNNASKTACYLDGRIDNDKQPFIKASLPTPSSTDSTPQSKRNSTTIERLPNRQLPDTAMKSPGKSSMPSLVRTMKENKMGQAGLNPFPKVNDLDEFPTLGQSSSERETDSHDKRLYCHSTAWDLPPKTAYGSQDKTEDLPPNKQGKQQWKCNPIPARVANSRLQNTSRDIPKVATCTSAGARNSTTTPPSSYPQIGNATPRKAASTSEPANASPDPRKLPEDVFVLCDHFLEKNKKRPASVYDKTKACKGCENRSKLKYGFWSDNFKEWIIVRRYPEQVPLKVAFKLCSYFAWNRRCFREQCTFAHGEQELKMWTMEREGILPAPREILIGSYQRSRPSPESSSMTSVSPQLRFRPSPPGVTNGRYRLCKSLFMHETCRFGRGCLFAHSKEELEEWIQEFQRKERERSRKECEGRDETSSLEMASKVLNGPAEDRTEFLPGVGISCTPYHIHVKLTESSSFEWTFTLNYKTDEVGHLCQVLLVHRYHNMYRLKEISVGSYQQSRGYDIYKLCYSAKLNEPWYRAPRTNLVGRVKVTLTVVFESPLYGNFEQWVLFDFGKKPYLIQKLNVDVVSTSSENEQNLSRHDGALQTWDESSVEVVKFVHGTEEAVQKEHLSRIYSLSKQPLGLIKTPEGAEQSLSRANYKSVMHQLLFSEELYMKGEISSYKLSKTQLHAQRNIFNEMSGMTCAVDGELFGVLSLHEEDALRPDDAAGRLLYRNVSSVWLQLADTTSKTVYEAPVEKVESECVVLKLSSKMCTDLSLFDTCDVEVNAQFQLNRSPLCQMHAAIDRLKERQMSLLFPEERPDRSRREVHIRWQWFLDGRLNPNQKKVIERITAIEYDAPPLVVFGPFGTGKTFTLSQSVRLIVQVDKSNRVLLCTHSNRAADNHVELLDEYLTAYNGVPAAKPLRIYQPMRKLETVSETARKYCLIKDDMFVLPTRDNVVQYRVVITTLSTSQVLLSLQVHRGFFSHILVDEAAQALECEMLTPLFLAGPNTKVVFTGDHMQMSPEVYSPQARNWGLHKSLAERLFDHYDKKGSDVYKDENVLFLTENYRCHKDILQFPSYNFYGEKLVPRGHANQPAHPEFGPLLFYSARGKETKEDDNSYINLSEVYEVVKRVKELVSKWPTAVWGPKKLSEIAVLSAYRYQVQAIRNNLRKDRDLKDIKVDTIHNVQGEEFRALFISTVRTFHTCKPQQDSLVSGTDTRLYWEFLSDPKLLNTAVTRARCLVAVIGDPVSLCTLGECRSLWRDYIKRCDENGGLHGTEMDELEKEINASIASIQLNPEAETFVPSNLQSIEVNPASQETTSTEMEQLSSQPNKTEELVRPLAEGVYKNVQLTEDQLWYQEEEIRIGDEEQDKFQEELFEDEAVFSRYMDEIIKAFVTKCEETLQLDSKKSELFRDEDFPALQSATSKQVKSSSVTNEPFSVSKRRADLEDLFPEVRLVNGRVEIRLVNLGFYKTPSERAQRIMVSSKNQEFLDPAVLRRMIEHEPHKYIVCNLRLSPEKSEVAYAVVEDTCTPDIQIKGRVRQAFDKDRVVVELFGKKESAKGDSSPGIPSHGKVVGVLEHIISPHERQYVCTIDYENPPVMIPINKAATKLVNMTDKSCKDIPIYRKEQNDKPTVTKMMKRDKALSGKYLFVVKYLGWRREFSYPLGIAVKALPRGEDLRTSMEIIFAEHGIRRAFAEETAKYVREKYPSNWLIPEQEYLNRTKIETAFTIDPPGSEDLDDALTVEKTSSSTFRVGVHIADVSFFVESGTPLDREAFIRCTSYYTGQAGENVPMLPRELSENHCSLLPNQDRLAVSVFLSLDSDGNITDAIDIKRTIVRSCCRLDYFEAQAVIVGRNGASAEVPEEVKASIGILSTLAQKRRRNRLGDSAFDHWQNEEYGDDFEAHELVEEMMILANQEIARYLSENEPQLAPLRVQLPPKDHRLREWIEMHGKYIKFSNQFSRFISSEGYHKIASATPLSENMKFKVQRSVWCEMNEAAKAGDLRKLQSLICDESNHPQVATAHAHFWRIQSESRYVCEGDQPAENIIHFSLGTRCYTHFTSPIRRYIDILVHRFALGILAGCCVGEAFSKDEMAKICRRSTFSQDNARKFGKACRRVQRASCLQQRGQETLSFIESIDTHSISLHLPNKENELLVGRQRKLLMSHLSPIGLDDKLEDEHKEPHVVLRWKVRMYKAPDVPRPVTGDGGIRRSDTTDRGVIDVPSDMWMRVLDAVKSDEGSKLIERLKDIELQLRPQQANVNGERSSPKFPPTEKSPSTIYKHPHHDDQSAPNGIDSEGHFYEKSLALRKFDYFNVQLSSHMISGTMLPDIQLLKVNPRLCICIEHQKYPRESFSVTARHQASKEKYDTIDDYERAWKPVLAMEAATEAVKEDDSFTIEGLPVRWNKEDNVTTGIFILTSSYCDSCQLNFQRGDFVCVLVPYAKEMDRKETNQRQEEPMQDDGETKNPPDAASHLPEGDIHPGTKRDDSAVWVGHCIIQEVNQKKEKNDFEVTIELHQASSKAPQHLFDGNCHRGTFQLIHRTLPHRRMYSALCVKLKDASSLVHSICKGQEPDQEFYGNEPTGNLSVVAHHPRSSFQRLDEYQEAAVKQALTKPFTLIQGPPGTGKTMTGVHIAYWFAKRNLTVSERERETDEQEHTVRNMAPAQVLYCGPSNESVNVVAEYLLRIPKLKILRVYSDQIEQKEFPVPNKLKPLRRARNEDEMRGANNNLRPVSLQHVIREPECPYSQDIWQMEAMFAEDKQKGSETSKQQVSEYLKLIGLAKKYVIQESGVQVILCTCAVAGGSTITSYCDNIQQCIVDECGMCLELESLVPITCSGARQVVLIGDHKQLQPIVHDKVAMSLGFNVSMFERHSKRAIMLELQYRMHQGICEFPSKQFYEEKLKTADIIKTRTSGPVSFWPAQLRQNRDLPIVFCHVEGQEEAVSIKTTDSNEESKRNMKEVRKVVYLAKYIVNHHRHQLGMSDVAILSPYREQCSKIRELLTGNYEQIPVKTVIKSQGSEWDYVIISLVRSLKKDDLDPDPSRKWLRRQLGFLTDEHQMNVALTRARKGLCIIGNKHLLSLDPMWKNLLQHYEENHCVVDETWPWP